LKYSENVAFSIFACLVR